jgi:hypothetical protein
MGGLAVGASAVRAPRPLLGLSGRQIPLVVASDLCQSFDVVAIIWRNSVNQSFPVELIKI